MKKKDVFILVAMIIACAPVAFFLYHDVTCPASRFFSDSILLHDLLTVFSRTMPPKESAREGFSRDIALRNLSKDKLIMIRISDDLGGPVPTSASRGLVRRSEGYPTLVIEAGAPPVSGEPAQPIRTHR